MNHLSRCCGVLNNTNNLILRLQLSHTPNWCMRPPCLWDKGPPCFWDKGPPLCNDLTVKVYEGIHTLPHSGFEPVTS
jgi:hypothetical protein